jgi:hypothetical protein
MMTSRNMARSQWPAYNTDPSDQLYPKLASENNHVANDTGHAQLQMQRSTEDGGRRTERLWISYL